MENSTSEHLGVATGAVSENLSGRPRTPFLAGDPRMRAQLAAALRAQPQDEGNAETNALRALHKKRAINVLATTVKTSVDVRVVLEDPKLPSKQDLGRWWPEPARSNATTTRSPPNRARACSFLVERCTEPALAITTY